MITRLSVYADLLCSHFPTNICEICDYFEPQPKGIMISQGREKGVVSQKGNSLQDANKYQLMESAHTDDKGLMSLQGVTD